MTPSIGYGMYPAMNGEEQTDMGTGRPAVGKVGILSTTSLGFAALLVIVWVILHEQLTPRTLLTGVLVSLFTLAFTNGLVLKQDYCSRYAIRPFALLRYIGVLIVQIYIAGFHAMRKILTGGLNVDIVEIETSLENDFHIALLANSITLTPGTVTMEIEGQRLKVIWIDAYTKDTDIAGTAIKGSFERMLAQADIRTTQREP